MLERCISELITWFRAFLEAVPGEIGCFLRRHLYGFVAGRYTRVLSHVTIYYPENLKLGRNVGIAAYSQINAIAGIEIGDNVLVGPGALIWSQNHRFSSADVPITSQDYDRVKVTIEEDCWIAGGAIVLPGVRLARGTVVAAGSVVTRSTEPFSIVAGVPARAIGSRTRSG
jgi:maltose O-acetyltransferase